MLRETSKDKRAREQSTRGKDRMTRRLSSLLGLDEPGADSIRDSLHDAGEGMALRAPWLMVHPHSPFKVGWDCVGMVAIIYSTLTVPLWLSFGVEHEWSSAIGVFEWCVDGFFLSDMLMTFRTGIPVGETVSSGAQPVSYSQLDIARVYLRAWFWIDLVASVPIDKIVAAIIGDDSGNALAFLQLLRLTRLVRLVRLIKLSKTVSLLEQAGVISPTMLRLAGLLFQLIFFAHLFACAWFFVGRSSATEEGVLGWVGTYEIKQVEYAWGEVGLDGPPPLDAPGAIANATAAMRLAPLPLINATHSQQWVSSLYWAITTLSTVGYGDIYPTNDVERFFVLIAMLFGVITFGYITSSIRQMTRNSHSKDVAVGHKLELVSLYMQDRNVPRPLRRQILRYFEYNAQRKKMFNMHLLDELSHALRNQLTMHEYAEYIDAFPQLRDQEVSFLAVLCPALEPFFVMTGEFIVYAGVVSLEMFWVHHGLVRMLDCDDTVVAYELSDGGVFGYKALSRRVFAAPFTAIGAAPSHLLYLSKDAMHAVAQHVPDAIARLDVKETAEPLNARQRNAAAAAAASRQSAAGLASADSSLASADSYGSHRRGSFSEMSCSEMSELSMTDGGRSESGRSEATPKPNRERSRSVPSIRSKLHSGVSKTGAEVAMTGQSFNTAKCARQRSLKRSKTSVSKLLKNATAPEPPKAHRDAQHEHTRRRPEGVPWWVVMPWDRRKLGWDIASSLLTTYSSIVVPYRLAFLDEHKCGLIDDGDDDSGCGAVIFDTLVDVFFLVDICLSFVTAVQPPVGETVVRPRDIARHYLLGFFVLDLASALPLQLIAMLTVSRSNDSADANDDSSTLAASLELLRLLRLLRLARLLKLLRLLRMNAYFKKLYADLGLNKSATELAELANYLALVLHLLACAWFGSVQTLHPPLVDGGEQRQLAWASLVHTDPGLGCDAAGYCAEHARIDARYLYSMYWALTTLSTIGFGDICANSDGEKLFACAVMLLGSVMLGYILSRVTDLIGTLDAKGTRRRNRLHHVKVSVRDALLPPLLQRRLGRYYSHYLSDGMDYVAEQSLLVQLSPPLRTELLLFLSREMITGLSLLRGQEPAFVVSVCKTLQLVFAAPGDCIIKEGAVGHEMYFLQSGAIELLRISAADGTLALVEMLHAVAHFGEVALLVEHARHEATARALTFCCLFSFSRSQLHQLVVLFPRLKARLESLAKQRLMKVNPTARLRALLRTAVIVLRWSRQAGARPAAPAPALISESLKKKREQEAAARRASELAEQNAIAERQADQAQLAAQLASVAESSQVEAPPPYPDDGGSAADPIRQSESTADAAAAIIARYSSPGDAKVSKAEKQRSSHTADGKPRVSSTPRRKKKEQSQADDGAGTGVAGAEEIERLSA